MSSLSGISFSGLASGLDSASIIAKLVALERRPISLLKIRKRGFDAQKKLFGSLGEKLDKLKDAAKAIKLSSGFLDFKAEVSETGFYTASAGSGASVGTYNIEVVQLATAQVRTSDTKPDKDTTTFGTGTLVITVDGNAENITIDSSNNTLEGIAAAINAKGINVKASAVKISEASGTYKLILTAKNQGSGGSFTVSTTGATAPLQTLASELNTAYTGSNTYGEIIQAKDSTIKLDGVQITRASNTFSDVIDGVTLTLTGEHTTGNASTLTISTDAAETAGKIKAFVDAYNAIVDFIKDQQTIKTTDGEGGEKPTVSAKPLFGDQALRRIQSGLRSVVGDSVATSNQNYQMFAQIGIESDNNGRLTFKQSDFEEALVDDEVAVREIFTDTTDGISVRVYNLADDYTDSVDGIIKVRSDGIDRINKNIDKQIANLERRIKDFELNLKKKYANLEVLMGQLQAQMGSLISLSLQR